jgi:hypothetical protein
MSPFDTANEWAVSLLAVIRGQDGEIDWKIVFHGVVSAAIIGLATMVIDQGREISAINASREATIKAYDDRIRALESGNSAATSKRYTSEDAIRDAAKLEIRLEKIEERIRQHEIQDALRFKGLGR